MAKINKAALVIFTIVLFAVLPLGYFSTRYHDLPIYKCYALTFLEDKQHADILLKNSCRTDSLTDQAFQVLPVEYPLLALIPFTIPILFSVYYYEYLYVCEMFAVAMIIFFFLKKTAAFKSAWLFVLYLVLGSFGTALTRFDLLPGAFLLFCLHSAISKKYINAYIFLAIATMLKFFPILLLVPLFLQEQSHLSGSYFKLHRYKGVFIFLLICAVITAVTFDINPAAVVSPFHYFTARPFEIESFPASVLWFVSLFGVTNACIGLEFNSWNLIAGAPSACVAAMKTPAPLLVQTISVVFLLCFICGLVWLYYKSWRKKISLEMAFLLTLLLELLTGKILSPQYLIWLTPLMAYIFTKEKRWIFLWSGVCVFTTIIYPFLIGDTWILPYMNDSLLFPAICIRNTLLLVLFISLMVKITKPEKIKLTT